MICEVCKDRPAIYGDGLTWARCDKCQADYMRDLNVNELKEQAPIDGTGVEHQTVKGLTSVIIPVHMISYNLFHMTGNCIGSVREHTDIDDYELIIVDNGSTIQPPELKSYYADKVIKNDKNLGYTKAVNQGIRAAFGEYIVLLNNDTLVYDGWLAGLKREVNGGLNLAMAHPMYSRTEPFARAFEAKQVKDGSKKFDPIPGERDFSCVMFKKELVDELDLFDEQFFNYCSDQDFLKRMELAGKKFGIVDNVAIHHISDATGYSLAETAQVMNEDKKKYEEKWNNYVVSDPPNEIDPGVILEVSKKDDGTTTIEKEINLIRTQETGDAVYFVKDGKTHHVRSIQVLEALGFKIGQEKTITRAEFIEYKPGEPITMENVSNYA